MSIQTEIERIKNNLLTAYEKAASKGANIPAIKNSSNLPNTIDTIKEEGPETSWWNKRTKNNTDWTGVFSWSPDNTLLSELDSSKVTELDHAFYASKNSSIPQFNFSSVINAKNCFNTSSILNLPDLNFPKLKSMESFI